MNKNEKLNRIESETEKNSEYLQNNSSLDFRQVEHMYSSRSEMLASIKEYIPEYLNESFHEKIDLEKKILLEIIEIKMRILEAKKISGWSLDEKYFTKKPLNIINF